VVGKDTVVKVRVMVAHNLISSAFPFFITYFNTNKYMLNGHHLSFFFFFWGRGRLISRYFFKIFFI
jgi:hypothetical protein